MDTTLDLTLLQLQVVVLLQQLLTLLLRLRVVLLLALFRLRENRKMIIRTQWRPRLRCLGFLIEVREGLILITVDLMQRL